MKIAQPRNTFTNALKSDSTSLHRAPRHIQPTFSGMCAPHRSDTLSLSRMHSAHNTDDGAWTAKDIDESQFYLAFFIDLEWMQHVGKVKCVMSRKCQHVASVWNDANKEWQRKENHSNELTMNWNW